jgi:hypothetical protein
MKIISKLAGGLTKGRTKSDLSEATLFLAYFQGFPADKRGSKKIEITSYTGYKVEVNFETEPSMEILSVNVKKKGEDTVIERIPDVIIELKNCDIEKDSQLYVEIIISAMSITAQSISNHTNTFALPKKSFINFDLLPLSLVGKIPNLFQE